MKLFYNAKIYSPTTDSITAFVIGNGYFLSMGSDTQILNEFSHISDKVDLKGRTIWPGLTDSHLHLQHLAESQAMIDCETDSFEECLNRIEDHAQKLPPKAWVRGHGWNQNNWSSGFGNASSLDKVCGGRPAYLTAKSLHAAWVNSKSLALAGINRYAPDPANGIILRDQVGEPSGILLEASSMEMIEKIIPEPSPIERLRQLQALIPNLWRNGLVGVHDFDGPDCWETLQNCYQKGALNLRVRKNIPLQLFESFIDARLRTDFGDDWLNIGNLKLFADGALGPQTAAMFEPYENTDRCGTLLLTEQEIYEIGKRAVNNGIALSIHAIGDLANNVVLNAYERLRLYEENHHLPHYRHRIEHVQTIQPEDLARLAKLDIVASVQPIHATSDMDTAEKFLGERAKLSYSLRSLVNSGAVVAMGSDAPVESANPFWGIHAAVTRRRLDGRPGKSGWYSDQRLTLDEAIMGYSFIPALISHRGGLLGKIAQGYKADFLILSEDISNFDNHELAMIQPAATFIEGNCVFWDESLPEEVFV